MPRPAACRVLKVDPERPTAEAIAEAARVLRAGGLVAFPTETVYGLGADALSAEAVARIFAAKGRPADNPLIVHVGSPEEVGRVAREVPPLARHLMERFWPGPLTLVLPRSPVVPLATTGGLDTVAVRMPSHPVALALVRVAGVPVAAPSANRSGRPSPTRAEHVLEDLGEAVDLVLDGGPCPVGVESTVVDITGPVPVVLRPGGLPKEAIEEALGRPVQLGAGPEMARRSPGTRYRHYAPSAPLVIVAPQELVPVVRGLLEEGKLVGLLARHDPGVRHERLRSRIVPGGLRAYARELFDALRSLDGEGCQVIVAEAVEEQGLGLAVMDRLRRASAS
ncbi:MAG TPA: L-threonylcarbamoyladenylate synthase [Dehalococcoidia bacterium]|nr:L-threonylcarbamoyladenylate synthase [Dehalococcoidia bacterium]